MERIKLAGREILFLPRHGKTHEIPPHRINFRANIFALRRLGVTHVIATNAVGSLRKALIPGSFFIPSDFLDFTKQIWTFYENKVVHADMSSAFDKNLSKILFEACKTCKYKVKFGGIYIGTSGPRFETPAEIKMYKKLGGDVVGMTAVPEVILANELKIKYASLCIISNYAAGMQEKLSLEEVFEIVRSNEEKIRNVLEKAVELAQKPGKENL